MVALAFCINLYSVCIISDTTGNQVCLVINTKKMRAGKNKIKYYQEAAIKSFFLTAARLLSSLALPELTSVFFLHNWLYYIIYTCPTNVQEYCIVPSNFSEHFLLKNVYVSFWDFISIKCKYALQKWWREASRVPCRFWIARKLMHYTNLFQHLLKSIVFAALV